MTNEIRCCGPAGRRAAKWREPRQRKSSLEDSPERSEGTDLTD